MKKVWLPRAYQRKKVLSSNNMETAAKIKSPWTGAFIPHCKQPIPKMKSIS